MEKISFKNKEYTLRLADKGDVSALRKLVNEAYKELSDMGLNYTATYQGEEITKNRISKGRAFVLVDNEEIIATILLSKENYFTKKNTAYISQFAVSPAHKKSGIGSILMDHCERIAENENFDGIQLDTAKPAKHLVKWYLKRGYKIVGDTYWEGKTYESFIFEKDLAVNISYISDSALKREILDKTLRSLPKWFGIESAIVDYTNDTQKMDTWSAKIKNDAVGFISINKHNKNTAEIHVMGILESFHGKGIGKKLIEIAEDYLSAEGFKFLQVKTLSESRADVNYDKTRKFYLKNGFMPFEEFKTLWGEHNPCLQLVKNIELKPTQKENLAVSSFRVFEHLYELEQQLHKFQVRSNPNILAKLLSPNFFEFGSSGNQWTLQDILDRLPTEDGNTKIEAREFKAHQLSSDVILITYISKRISENGESKEFLRSSIWKNHSGSWAMEFHQGTSKT